MVGFKQKAAVTLSNPIKIVTVVGARPQFIKAAPVSLALKAAGIQEILVDTGQHYDDTMRRIFFEQLDLNTPQYQLAIGSGSHGYQTGEGLVRLEPIYEQEKPDAVLVYGDTNATLSGALAAAKMHIPVAHVEAGLRSFNRRMPEEVNRVMVDHLAQWLFAPTQTAVEQLAKEGIQRNVHFVGDVMLDATLMYRELARKTHPDYLSGLSVQPKDYYLLTLHRAETTASPSAIREILSVLDAQEKPVLFPMHPRVRPLVQGLGPFRNIRLLEPFGYFEMLLAEESALAIITDSGGVQKEAAFLEVPCITLREETEWLETVQAGWNTLVGLSSVRLKEALTHLKPSSTDISACYGNGLARQRIADILCQELLGSSSPRPELASSI
jgi:UDP-N-acetylglucosamine 2-epimerase